MKDTKLIGEDGFPIQEYTIHIGKPIYARADLSARQNMEYLANRNFEVWKEIYESEYGMPLEY